MASNAEVKRPNEAHASMADAERQGSATNLSQIIRRAICECIWPVPPTDPKHDPNKERMVRGRENGLNHRVSDDWVWGSCCSVEDKKRGGRDLLCQREFMSGVRFG